MKRTPSQAAKKTARRGSPQVQMILRAGNKAEKDFLALYWASAEVPGPGKKTVYLIVGKRALRLAHDRNRAKRLVREICRERFRAAGKSRFVAVRVVRSPGPLSMARFKSCLDPLLDKALTG